MTKKSLLYLENQTAALPLRPKKTQRRFYHHVVKDLMVSQPIVPTSPERVYYYSIDFQNWVKPIKSFTEPPK
jgi:hypothetical protein